jgi:hypothetical protein
LAGKAVPKDFLIARETLGFRGEFLSKKFENCTSETAKARPFEG